MNKVIIYENRKVGPQVWDASSPEKEDEAFLDLVETFEHWNAFGFSDQIERAESQIERLEEALENEASENGRVWVRDSHDPKRAESKDPEEVKRALVDARKEAEKLEVLRAAYRDAKNGNPDAARRVVRWAKNNASQYADYNIVEVQNA